MNYDAVLLLSFGGPEGPDDVLPFLENVLRGRNVPPERLREVAHHYDLFGGKSPINDQNRALLAALRVEFDAHGLAHLPLYWGNRNWHPLLRDTLVRMQADGVQRALALVTSAYSSYSGCRQYREDVQRARAELGAQAPHIDKLRSFHDHPGFVEANVARVRAGLACLPAARRAEAALVFSAHSIPSAMAANSRYEAQLRETCELVASALDGRPWELVYQSRSGPPQQPWLGPDVCEHLRLLPARGVQDVLLMPVGFVSDHMEVVYDLDTEAADVARQVGLGFVRAPTVGTHPAFVAMLRELVQERLDPTLPRRAMGRDGARPDVCPDDCCPAPVSQRPAGAR
jgi:ferrochelatase